MKAQALLVYYPDGTQFSRTPARLNWTDDDRLVLERVDEQGAGVETFFDAPIAEVQITGGMSVPKFTVGGRGHRVDFAESARIASNVTGAIGAAVGGSALQGAALGGAIRGTAASGVEQWMAALRAAGASSRYWTTGKIMGVTLGAVAALVVLIFASLVVASLVVAVTNAGSFVG